MKKKFAVYATIPVLALGLFSASAASAHGLFMNTLTPEDLVARQQERFQQEATILGISVDDVKAAWAQGKSVGDIIKEKGLNQTDIDARIKSATEVKMKTNLQTLVDKGVITQAQADTRLATMKQRTTAKDVGQHRGFGKGGRGMGMHGGFMDL